MSVQEVADTAASWVKQIGSVATRRSVLLKVSAGLALAGADPSFGALHNPSHVNGMNLAGVWHSRYQYYSSSRDQQLVGEHYVVLHQWNDQLIGESVPAKNGSVLRFEMIVNGSAATGTWTERTSPSGYYRGRVYHGAIQFVIDPMGKSMAGKWVGMDRDFNVNSDAWELHWVDDASSRKAPKSYASGPKFGVDRWGGSGSRTAYEHG